MQKADLESMMLKMKRNQLVCLMRDVGVKYKEDKIWMESYIVDVVKLWSSTSDKVELALACFRDLKERGVK